MGPLLLNIKVAGKWILIPHIYAIYCNIMQLYQHILISLDLTNPPPWFCLEMGCHFTVDHSSPIEHILCFMIVRYPPPMFGQTYIKILQLQLPRCVRGSSWYARRAQVQWQHRVEPTPFVDQVVVGAPTFICPSSYMRFMRPLPQITQER